MAITTNALDAVMRREYEEEALKAFTDPATRSGFAPTVGFETEYSVVWAGSTDLVNQEVRDGIVAKDIDLMEQELGEWQLEVKSNPVNLATSGFDELEAQVKGCEQRAVRAARLCGAELVRIGSYPLHHLDQIRRSRARRYDQVVRWHNEHHSEAVPTFIGALQATRPATAEIIALMNSVQFNLATPSAEEAIELLNTSFAILPQVIAVSGNSRYLDGVDTLYADTRMILWEKTHDTRTAIELITNAPHRVGLPSRYFKDIEDYISYVRDFPFILNNPGGAFKVGTGLNWSDARLKVRDHRILLEFRPVSVQPSVKEDIAVCAFYIGLLMYYRETQKPLPPFVTVRDNRFRAMRHGLRADFIEMDGEAARQVPAKQVIEEGLEKASVGLSGAGFEGGLELLEPLQGRLRNMRAPSDEFAARIELSRSSGISFRDALSKAVRECVVTEGK